MQHNKLNWKWYQLMGQQVNMHDDGDEAFVSVSKVEGNI